MPHLVEFPLPSGQDYRIPRQFKLRSPDGRAKILAWGTDLLSQWRVGTENVREVLSEKSFYPGYPELALFDLRGVRQGLKLALFTRLGEDQAWMRYSEYVEVDVVAGDSWALAASSGKLPKSSYSKYISFYPFGATQADPSMTEPDWMNAVEAALREISGNEVGRAVLSNITKGITIYPYLPSDKGAAADVRTTEDVRINPAQWAGDFRPCCRVDEILLHELIHVVENHAGGYENGYGFAFDRKDFLTVNATNVYSCMLGRALRKDHWEFAKLPDEYFYNPKRHYEEQKSNYELAAAHAQNLVDTLKNVRNFWSPFSYLDSGRK